MQFKASSLAKHSPELLTVMSQMYQDDLNYNSTKIMKLIKKFEHTGMLDTFQKSYQSVDDFVISCQYGRKKQCMDSVKQFLTPNGICFSISPNSTVVRAGPESTLSILLNLETYDSIPGYVNDPGVILSIYDSNYTYPTRFYDDGVHLEPGKLVTIPINDIRSFERHHTECGVTSSGSFTPKQYSKLACEWVAKTEVIGKECKCSPLNSPDNRFIFGDDLGSGHFNKHFVFNVTSSSLPNCTLEQEYTCVKLILEQPLVKLQENYKNNNKCPEDCSDVRFTTIVFGNELDVNEVSSLLPINWEDEKEKKISDFYKAFALIPKNRISIIKSIQKLSIEAQEFIHSTKTLLHDFNNINKSVLFDVQNIKIHNCEAMFDSTILPKVFLELNTRERIWRNFAIYYDYVLTPNLVETPRLLKYNFNKFYGNENVNMFGRQNSTNDLNKENMDTLFDASMFELKLIQSSLENPLSVFGIKSMLEGERNTTINLMKNLVNATSQCLSKWKMTKNEESAAHRCGNVFNDNFIPLQAARFVAKILNGSDFLADFYQSLKNLTTIINNSAGKNGAKIFTYNNFEINLNEFQSFYKDDGNDLPLLFEIFRQRKLIQFEIPAKSSDISTTLFHFINSRSYFYSHKLDTAKSPFISLLNRTAYCFSNFSTTITTLKKQPFLRADWISRLNRDVIIAQSYSPGPQFDKVNLLHVKLYFSHIKRETIKNERSYNIFLLLAELGGTIGLYLGASIITGTFKFAFYFNQSFEIIQVWSQLSSYFQLMFSPENMFTKIGKMNLN
uniref:Nicastrin n=1 Tax=Rhabditophanes sp. KR3021 TaxID=114890 RepID=A0AC35TXF3_9BILA